MRIAVIAAILISFVGSLQRPEQCRHVSLYSRLRKEKTWVDGCVSATNSNSLAGSKGVGACCEELMESRPVNSDVGRLQMRNRRR